MEAGRRRRLGACGLVLGAAAIAASGCASALREPAALAELAGDAEGVPDLPPAVAVEEARARFERREPDSVRQAAVLWTRAAASRPDALEPLASAVRARIWLADHLEDPEERRRQAESAVQTAQWCRRRAPEDPACAYWLGAALGVQARERRTTALDALPRIVELFREAAEAAPLLDEAGPHRALAFVYARAPGWPTGPGDPSLAVAEARRAVELRPGHPPNLLALGEALDESGLEPEAREAFRRALDLARRRLEAGEPDAAGWVENARKALASP